MLLTLLSRTLVIPLLVSSLGLVLFVQEVSKAWRILGRLGTLGHFMIQPFSFFFSLIRTYDFLFLGSEQAFEQSTTKHTYHTLHRFLMFACHFLGHFVRPGWAMGRTNGRPGRDGSCPSAYLGQSFAALATAGRTLISNLLIPRKTKPTFVFRRIMCKYASSPKVSIPPKHVMKLGDRPPSQRHQEQRRRTHLRSYPVPTPYRIVHQSFRKPRRIRPASADSAQR